MYLLKNKKEFLGYVKSILILTASLLLLPGCFWNQQQPSPRPGNFNVTFTNKTYIVDRLETSGRLDNVEGFPHTFTLNFKTCVTDSRKQRTSVPDRTQFIIEYETAEVSNGSYKKVTRRTSTPANEYGCIFWSEIYPYKHIFKKRWIGLSRIIEGVDGSFYHGKEVVETAVNPWIFKTEEGDEFPPIIDMRPIYSAQHSHILEKYSYEKEGLKFLMEGALEYPQLWVNEIDIQMRFAKDHLDRAALNPEELIKSYTTLCGFDENGNKVPFIEGKSLCYNRKLIMDLAIPLQIRTLGVKGKAEESSIDGGTYNIKAYLVAQPEGGEETQYYLLHREKYLEKKNVSKGRSTEGTYQSTDFLTVKFPVDILFGNQNATYKLVLEVKNNEGLFKKFEGVYTLGEKVPIGSKDGIENDNWLIARYKALFGDKKFQTGDKTIHEISSMELVSLFNGPKETQKEMIKRLEDLGFHTNQLEVIVNDGEIRFANVKSSKNCYESENVVERTIEYSVRAHFKDFFGKDPKRTPFRVIVENPLAKNPADRLKEIRKKTDDGEEGFYFTHSGASIQIYDELSHKNYNRQIYTERKIHFISKDGQFYGQARVGLNPWQGQFQFGKDLTTTKKIRTKRDGVLFPRLVINQFRAINFFPFYLIDRLLNIHISHNYYFLFQVIIQRPDNIEHGRHPMGREFIRDGYHLARVLIMRSPVEMEKTVKRLGWLDDYNKQRESILYNEDLEPSFAKGGEYISHVDTVINVRGNWVNIYIPSHFNHQQFIYLASRNQITIQVYPADPRGFVYKKAEVEKGKQCELDLEKTTWCPYFSCKELGTTSLESDDCHELEIVPHTAPIQTNEWHNWNVLRRAPHINTDKIIAQSELGLKRKHFSFHPKPGEKSPCALGKPLVVENNETTGRPLVVSPKRSPLCSAKPYYHEEESGDLLSNGRVASGRRIIPNNDINDCFSENIKDVVKEVLENGIKEDFMNGRTPLVDVVGEEGRNQKTVKNDREGEQEVLPEILKKFADKNALKVVDLSRPEEAEKLVSDLNETGDFFQEHSKEISTLLAYQSHSSEEKPQNVRNRGYLEGEDAEDHQNEMGVLSSALMRLMDILSPEKLENLKTEIQVQCRPEETEEKIGIGWKIKTIAGRLFSSEDEENRGTDEDLSWKESVSNSWSSLTNFSVQDFFLSKIESDFAEYYNECSLGLIRNELAAVIGKHTVDSNGSVEETDSLDVVRDNVAQNSAALMYEPSSEENHADFLIKNAFLIVSKTTQDQIQSIVNRGVTTSNYKEPAIGSFIHNLCSFWFDKYFSDYLTSEQMVSSYTNFIRKFDYNEILENRDLTYSNFNADQLFHFLGMNEENGPGKCVKDHSNCLLNARCNIADSFSCQYRTKDKSCTLFLRDHCQSSYHQNPFCKSLAMAFFNEESCQKEIGSYCRQNSSQTVCHLYNDRCEINQQQCLGGLATWFEELKTGDIFGTLMYSEVASETQQDVLPIVTHKQTPFKTCLANPFEFFRFERKMAVLELDTDSFEYLGGIPFNTSVSFSHSITSALRWSGSTSTSLNLGPSLSLDFKARGAAAPDMESPAPNVGKRRKFGALDRLDGGAKISIDGKMGMSSSVSNSGGEDLSVRVLEGTYLNVHQSIIKMDVKKFKKCLVIKPRPNAFFSHLKDNGLREKYSSETVWSESFHANDMKKVAVSRPGLLICNPVEEREPDNPETIVEHYYYLAQELSRNMEFMFLYDIRNRPFTMILRGQKEFFKYFSLLKELRVGRDSDGQLNNFEDKVHVNFFAKYSYPIEEMVGLNYTIRALNETGFQPGIYTYPDRDWLNTEFFRKSTSPLQGLIEYMEKENPFPVVSPSKKAVSVNPWGVK